MVESLVLRALEPIRDAHLELAMPDGSVRSFGQAGSDLRARLEVRNPRFFHRVLTGGDVGTGDSYVDGDWDSPDLVAVVRMAVRNRERIAPAGGLLGLAGAAVHALRHWANRNTLSGSRRNIAAHYDLSNDFFRLFLDRNMVYSSAIFPEAEATLEAAQMEKIDRLCRKLHLGAGDHVLEIGTGWGAFALHAARRYGCRVTTTTISRQQYEHAAALFDACGVAGQVQLLEEDYRHLRGEYDKIASIEMFEAVGLDNYDTFFAKCDSLLKPDGVLAMQTITMNEHRFSAYRRSSDWIQQRIFPGGQLASVRAVQDSLVRATSMNLHHLEDIGMHYAETLACWSRRFEENRREVLALGFDEPFLRTWAYYLAYCEGAFRERYIGNAQLVMAKRGSQRILPGEPWGARHTTEAVA